jgi:O-antigen/teichoic acid export membrane protein
LPAFAEKQDDHRALCSALYKIARLIGIVTIPITVLTIFSGSDIMAFVYGAEYYVVGIQFGLLFLYFMLLLQEFPLGRVFFALGMPGSHRFFVLIRAVFVILFIYPAIKMFSLTGAAAVLVISNVIAFAIQLVMMRKTIGLNTFEYISSWFSGCGLAIPVGLIILVSRLLMPEKAIIHISAGLVVFAVGVFVVLIWPRLKDLSARLSNQNL